MTRPPLCRYQKLVVCVLKLNLYRRFAGSQGTGGCGNLQLASGTTRAASVTCPFCSRLGNPSRRIVTRVTHEYTHVVAALHCCAVVRIAHLQWDDLSHAHGPGTLLARHHKGPRVPKNHSDQPLLCFTSESSSCSSSPCSSVS